MADAPPLVFDRALARQRLARALAASGPAPDFLLARAAADLDDRLALVRRDFPLAIDLGTPTDAAAAVLRRHERVGCALRLAPIPAPGAVAVADAETLPLAPGSVDLLVSLLALQGANDLPGALAQIRRALRPDGLFLACLLGGDTLGELRLSLAAAEGEDAAGASPRVAPFADIRTLGALLQRAGFALPVVDLDRVVVRYADPFGLMSDLRAMGAANALSERSRRPLRRATLMRCASVYAERFADPDGRVRATFDLVWLSGWAPHPDQPKPLAPGSATTRLADALAPSRLTLEGETS